MAVDSATNGPKVPCPAPGQRSGPGRHRPPQTAPVDFERDVRPILQGSWLSCHAGPVVQAELRMDSRDALRKGGVSGTALVPGKSGESLLLQRVRGEGGALRMPPGLPLPDEQVALLAAWVDAGAPWPEAVPTGVPVAGGAPMGATEGATTGRLDFVRDIQPILTASCYACHAGEKPWVRPRFDAKSTALKVIAPGQSGRAA